MSKETKEPVKDAKGNYKDDEKFPGGITGKQINDWMAEHGEVHLVKVDDKVGYFKKPSRATVASVLKKFGEKDTVKGQEILVKNTWLGGDSELQNNDAYFFGAANQLAELIDVKEGEIKKL